MTAPAHGAHRRPRRHRVDAGGCVSIVRSPWPCPQSMPRRAGRPAARRWRRSTVEECTPPRAGGATCDADQAVDGMHRCSFRVRAVRVLGTVRTRAPWRPATGGFLARLRFLGPGIASHQSHAQSPFEHPACGRRGVRSSAAMTKTRPLSARADPTATGAHDLGALVLLGQGTKLGDHRVSSDLDDVRRWRDGSARSVEQGGGLMASDPRNVRPALGDPRPPRLVLGRRQVQGLGVIDDFGREACLGQPGDAGWIGVDGGRRSQPRCAFGLPLSSTATRCRSRTKISTASAVRRTERPSMRRTTIGRRQLGQRRLRAGGGSITAAQYGHPCSETSAGRETASTSDRSLGSSGSIEPSRSSPAGLGPERRKTRSRNPTKMITPECRFRERQRTPRAAEGPRR